MQFQGELDLFGLNQLINATISIPSGTGTFVGWTLLRSSDFISYNANAEIYFDIPCVAGSGKFAGVGVTSNSALSQTFTCRFEQNGGSYDANIYQNGTLVSTFPGIVCGDQFRWRLFNGQIWLEKYTIIIEPPDPPYYPLPYEFWDPIYQTATPNVCGWYPLKLIGSAGAFPATIIRSAFQSTSLSESCWSFTMSVGVAMTGTGNTRLLTVPSGNGTYLFTASYADGIISETMLLIVGAGGGGGIQFTNAGCGSQKVAGSIVTLTHNAGSTATIQVSGGLLIPNTNPVRWQLPTVPGIYFAEIYLNNIATGVKCTITVVEPLYILECQNSVIEGIPPGQSLQLTSNLTGVVWSCVNEILAISPTGLFHAENAENGTFGEKWYQIKAVKDGQIKYCWIHVLPEYPRCPMPNDTKTFAPKFSIIKDVGERGCPDRRSIGAAAVYRWKLGYKSLFTFKDDFEHCEMTEAEKLAFCDDRSYETLLCFYKQVRGESLPFWFRDNEGTLWNNVYFEDFSNENYNEDENLQNVFASLIWESCCDDAPNDCPPPATPNFEEN